MSDRPSPPTKNPITLDFLVRCLLLAIAGMILLLIILTFVLIGINAPDKSPAKPQGTPSTTDTTSISTVHPPAVDDKVTLTATPDAGITYQDRITFVGDSLTAHLASRGVLTGGTATTQVWKTENNMLNLNSEVTSAKIILPGTGELLTIAEAAKKAKPEILVITLGTDWGVAYLGEEDFKSCYANLIKAIKKTSPDTKIILQSIFPVSADCTSLTNAAIDNANKWVKAVAAENGCRYLDTQSVLKDTENALKKEYCNSSDGIHLGTDAYTAILQYIRTHAISD